MIRSLASSIAVVAATQFRGLSRSDSVSPKPVAVEVCLGDVESVVEAVSGGVELCDSLSEGGTTPSFGAIAGAVEAASKSSTKVNVLIRPRARDFCYTSREVQAMVRDIAVARMLGADGVVVGALTPSGGIDFETLSAFVRAAKEPLNAESLLEVSFASTSCSSKDGKEGAWPTSISPETLPQINVTFHRAFDVLRLEVGASREGSACTAPSDAIDVDILLSALANAGVDRLLTSGMAPSAWEGRQFIRRLQAWSDKRVLDAKPSILIAAAAGVNSENATRLVAATGCCEVHAGSALAEDRPGLMRVQDQHQSEVSMGAASAGREHLVRRTAAWKVEDLVASVNFAGVR